MSITNKELFGFVIRRMNAWIDGFKNLIIKYETNA